MDNETIVIVGVSIIKRMNNNISKNSQLSTPNCSNPSKKGEEFLGVPSA